MQLAPFRRQAREQPRHRTLSRHRQLVPAQLSASRDANNLFPASQCACRTGPDTKTALLQMLNDVLHALGDGNVTLAREILICQLRLVNTPFLTSLFLTILSCTIYMVQIIKIPQSKVYGIAF